MSWMDSWSRPSKHQATPTPLYLLPGGESTPKPGKLDREIEKAFVKFLNGEESVPVTNSSERSKGDGRFLVPCDVVQAYVFSQGPEMGPSQGQDETNEGKSVADETRDYSGATPRDAGINLDVDVGGDMSEDHQPSAPFPDYDLIAQMSVRSGSRIRPPQWISEVNGSVGGEKGWSERIRETEDMKEKRLRGQKEVREKEMVRSAARRGVVFGFVVKEEAATDSEVRAKCEAVMHGKVVEPSYAKGGWAIRWRE
ncbi:hypothetical protein NKR23_g9307 [Pleurostoma richardsiae]|uniref:Uncharacterized protein n=1 Tax=Pleurostoma richardsiae TaxID=41990 RepID=A0AA38RN15_9PEZI|nr:hypothetical protein NKR23_g9307 [Pleurostoma richardsiae]